MRVNALKSSTSARLVVIAVKATLRTAAFLLSNPQFGLLVVCNENRKAAGVVSKSDLIRHFTAAGMAELTVAELMSRNVVSCRPEDDLYVTWERMTAQGVQNIPVLSTDLEPLGVLDIRDAFTALFEQEQREEQLLINYIAGVGYQ